MMDSGDMHELQAAFRNEAADLLSDLGDALLLLEQDQDNVEVVNRIFRAMHTLKGSGASAGFRRLAGFVHHIEDVFNRIRNRQLEASPELIDATLKACDCCALLLALDTTDVETPVPLEAEVLIAVRHYLPHSADLTEKLRNTSEQLVAVPAISTYRLQFHPHREVFFSGTDPATLLLELTDLGKLDVVCDPSALFLTEEFDPEQCYLRWAAVLTTDQPERTVREVFQFVEGDCEVLIERDQPAAVDNEEGVDIQFQLAAASCFSALELAVGQCAAGEEQGLATACRLARTMVSACEGRDQRTVALSQELLDAFLRIPENDVLRKDGWLTNIAGILEALRRVACIHAPLSSSPDKGLISPSVTVKMRASDLQIPEKASGTQSIRVDSAKLDALIRLAGELLIARGALPSFAGRIEQHISSTSVPEPSLVKEMRDAGAKVSRLAEDLQATVMSIRMMPVRQVFQRFPRLVRDIARALDKHIELEVSGEETELDKTVIDSIGDPIMHIIRNAADHGIESRAERLRKGKPAAGRIHLSAFTRGTNVNIEIRDDGKGLDPDKLKRRAVDKGLMTESEVASMDEQSALKIILEAGFSTVDEVTDLSGRGVGMDVARASVEALRGAIHISSERDRGTCFRIELPASLLVSKGILVALSGQQVVLPMETIRTMVKVPRSLLRTFHGQHMIPVRGSVYPLLSLAEALAFGSTTGVRTETINDAAPSPMLAIGLIETSAGPYALLVDRFIGEIELVIKPLSGVLAHMQEYIGASIMNDGSTVLVVNTERLFSLRSAETVEQHLVQTS